MSEVMELKKRSVSAHPTRFHLSEAVKRSFVFNAEEGTTVEDLLKPSCWAHIAEQLRPYDEIEARAEDGSWLAYLKVTSCERNWARVVLLSHHKINDNFEVPVESQLHEVKWKGPELKFCVIRISDGAKVQTGFDLKTKAYEWLRDHERTVRAAA